MKQGGILSPRLFNVYINDLRVKLYDSKIGGSVGDTLINHLCSADELCVISLCTAGMQELLYICE